MTGEYTVVAPVVVFGARVVVAIVVAIVVAMGAAVVVVLGARAVVLFGAALAGPLAAELDGFDELLPFEFPQPPTSKTIGVKNHHLDLLFISFLQCHRGAVL